jgi:stage II sporulation protein E
MMFAVAAIIAQSGLFGEVTPLSIAFMASLSGADTIFAFAGSLSALLLGGYVFEAIPTMAVLMVIGVFRVLLAGQSNNKLLNIASAALSGMSVGIVGSMTANAPTDIIAAIVMSVVCGLLTYCLTLTYRYLSGGQLSARVNTLAAPALVLIFACAVLSSFSQTNGFTLDLGVVFVASAALSSATLDPRRLSGGGAAVSIIGAMGVILSAPDFAAGMVILAVAAAASTLFVRHGRITQAAGFIFAAGIGVSAIGISTFTLPVTASAAVGALLYTVLPVGFASRIGAGRAGCSSAESDSRCSVRLPEVFAERLRLAGSALNDVKSAVEKAGEILDKRNTKDFSWVYNSAGDSVCRKCRNNMLCWGDEYSDTVSAFNKMATALRKGESLTEKDLPPQIFARCECKQQLLYALHDRHREYVTINSANRKISEMRTVLTAQLSATESLMRGMSEEFLDYSHFDREMAVRTEKVLSASGITRARASVTINEGRASIEAFGKGKLTCDAARLGDLIEEALQRKFDLPEVVSKDGEFRVTMYERAVYGVEYGACQLSKGGERSCGDYYDSFVDGKGYAYIILSDGMGSGSRARIDSAFACGMLVKLLRAGIGLPSALEIINNSLLVKSSDESFATLDICKIDLYTGKAELFKAGAAASYIRCNKKLIKAEGKGLPVGIGYRAIYESKSFTIGNSDIIIMASDGAELNLNERWLERELTEKGDLNETAKIIANAARYCTDREDDGREDDISVIAVKLVK